MAADAFVHCAAVLSQRHPCATITDILPICSDITAFIAQNRQRLNTRCPPVGAVVTNLYTGPQPAFLELEGLSRRAVSRQAGIFGAPWGDHSKPLSYMSVLAMSPCSRPTANHDSATRHPWLTTPFSAASSSR